VENIEMGPRKNKVSHIIRSNVCPTLGIQKIMTIDDDNDDVN